MQDVNRGSGENEGAEAVETLTAGETGRVQDNSNIQGSAEPEPNSGPDLTAGCIVRLVIESNTAAMEEAVSSQSMGQVEAAESFSVPEVLQPAQLVSDVYEASMDMAGIVGNMTEGKT